MRTIRRLYFYTVALISLEVVIWGLIGLLRSIFSSRLVSTANVLAQALALVLVGLPIFLFHWLWTQRAAAKDEEERSASLRAIFFYAVLIGTLVPVVQNLLALINRSILGVANVSASRAFLGGFQTWQDNLIAIFINALVALYFWNVLRDAWKSLTDPENFADVRRLYRYLWLLYSLLMVVFGAQQILRYVFYLPVPKYLLGDVGQGMFANGLTLLLVGTPLWVYVWRICQDALSISPSKGASPSRTMPAERDSNLRLGILYLLSLGGVITVLSAGGTLLDVVLRWAFGEAMEGHEFIQEIGGPISLGIPLAMVWVYYGSWLKRQIQSDEDVVRRAGKQRLYSYILSALGLGASFVGVALVLSFVIDLATSNAFWGASLRPRLAAAIATLAVGLPLWLTTWHPMQAEALTEGDAGDHARRSTIRRVYLYLALFAGVIGGMATAVGLVYLLINTLLTQEVDSDFVPRLLNMLQLLILFVVLLVYHLGCLRRDGAQAEQTLEARQREFPVLVIDPGNEVFVKAMTTAMSKHAPDVPMVVKSTEESVKVEDVKAVILPSSLVVEPPKGLQKWLKDFSGQKIVVAVAVSGWVLTALTPEQAAQSARQMAEGEEIRLAVSSPVWRVVQIAAVVLLGLQVLFFLLVLGISFFVG
jgi:hypothetical protein